MDVLIDFENFCEGPECSVVRANAEGGGPQVTMDTCDAPDDTISFEIEGRGIALVVEGGTFISDDEISRSSDCSCPKVAPEPSTLARQYRREKPSGTIAREAEDERSAQLGEQTMHDNSQLGATLSFARYFRSDKMG